MRKPDAIARSAVLATLAGCAAGYAQFQQELRQHRTARLHRALPLHQSVVPFFFSRGNVLGMYDYLLPRTVSRPPSSPVPAPAVGSHNLPTYLSAVATTRRSLQCSKSKLVIFVDRAIREAFGRPTNREQSAFSSPFAVVSRLIFEIEAPRESAC